ncbi:carboxymuconolactone decarboxylase family protein [Chloroflexota bacterium]
MESQVQLNEERLRVRSKFIESIPDFMALLRPAINEAYKPGALDTKTKRLMAMAIALGAGCTNCILGQTNNALDAGATTEEILDTLMVVVSMRGTTGIAESLRVVKLLEEMGKL